MAVWSEGDERNVFTVGCGVSAIPIEEKSPMLVNELSG
jgi:hypothetical protein